MHKKDLAWAEGFDAFFRGFAPLCAYCQQVPARHYLGMADMVYPLCDTHQCICGTSERGSHLCDSLFFDWTSRTLNPQGLPGRRAPPEVRARGIPEREWRRPHV